MPAPIRLRTDFDARTLFSLARNSADARQVRRLLAIAAIYEGTSRRQAAKIGGMTPQILRDWVLRFNADGPDGLRNIQPPGRPPWLSEAQMTELDAIIEAGPDPEQDGVVRWRRCDLADVIEQRFGHRYAERSVSVLLAKLGYVRITGRPQHPAQDEAAIEAFKKTSPPISS